MHFVYKRTKNKYIKHQQDQQHIKYLSPKLKKTKTEALNLG